MTTPITRAQAAESGLTRYYTGKPCNRGHDAERFVSNGSCIQCQKARTRVYVQNLIKARNHAAQTKN